MNAGLVLAMLAVVAAALVLVVAAAALSSVRRPWRLACPRDGREAQVRVDRAAAMRAEVFGGASGIARCSLWPARSCVEQCLDTPVTDRRMTRPGEPLPAWPGRQAVVVPLDGTPESEAVLPIACDVARARAARLRLLHVVRPVQAVHDPFGRLVAYVDQEAASAAAAARDYLRRVQARLDGFDVDTVVRVGDAAQEILREAAWPDVTLIAMAPRRRLLRRSVTSRVVRAAWVPVVRVAAGAAA
jgi:nucleotide-binding universal stress UspA family protein